MSTQSGVTKIETFLNTIQKEMLEVGTAINKPSKAPNEDEKKTLYEKANSILAHINAQKVQLNYEIDNKNEIKKRIDKNIGELHVKLDINKFNLEANKNDIARIDNSYTHGNGYAESYYFRNLQNLKIDPLMSQIEPLIKKKDELQKIDMNTLGVLDKQNEGLKTVESSIKERTDLIKFLDNKSEQFINNVNKPIIEQIQKEYDNTTSFLKKIVDFFKPPKLEDMKEYLKKEKGDVPLLNLLVTKESIGKKSDENLNAALTNQTPINEQNKSTNVEAIFNDVKKEYNSLASFNTTNDNIKANSTNNTIKVDSTKPTTYSSAAALSSKDQPKLNEIAKSSTPQAQTVPTPPMLQRDRDKRP